MTFSNKKQNKNMFGTNDVYSPYLMFPCNVLIVYLTVLNMVSRGWKNA